jgi:hypothetical protein
VRSADGEAAGTADVPGEAGASAVEGIEGKDTGGGAAGSTEAVLVLTGAAASSSPGRDTAQSCSRRWMPPVGPGDRK